MLGSLTVVFQRLLLSAATLVMLIRDYSAMEHKVYTRSDNIVQLLRLALQRGAYLHTTPPNLLSAARLSSLSLLHTLLTNGMLERQLCFVDASEYE
jgi:hypothetical protein